jgi:hypothetical protein
MAFRFSTNLSASARASRSRGTFPMSCLSQSAAFRGAFVFKRGPRRKKECMSLFSRKEDQHNDDRLLVNAWSKDYMSWREKAASRQLVRRESAHDADKTVAKAKWPKSGALLNDPHPKAGSAVTRRRLPLNSWPIGSVAINRGRSPRRLELDLWSFDRACVAGRSATRNISKHSGFAVPRARLGIYIAKRTPQKPTLQTAQGRHVRLIFGCNIQLESRDSIGSIARAIWTEEKLRSRPATWIALQG